MLAPPRARRKHERRRDAILSATRGRYRPPSTVRASAPQPQLMQPASVHSHPDLARIARALAASVATPAPRDEPFFEAAVALVLYAGEDGLETLFIKRATRDGDPWSGQIALPGGKRHEGEDSLMTTAVRETQEEIGLDLAVNGTLLGELDEIRPRSPLLPPIIVRPYVFAVT